ncbi:MAG: AI-2E family transporter [Deltaproteobacteria bacterium]|nr:MAG: AI-2E family transporter [Deltaproteobacteria bacterium]
MADPTAPPRTSQPLVAAACLVVVIGGLKLAAPVLLPVLMAAFVAVVAIPPIRWLERRGAPTWLAFALIVVAAAASLVFFIGVVGVSIDRFTEQLPVYQQRLDRLIANGLAAMRDLGLDIAPAELSAKIGTSRILDVVGNTVGQLLGALSNLALVLLIVIFMLTEAHGFSGKLRRALGDPDADLSHWTEAAARVYQYLFIKAIVSAATGVLVSLVTWALRVDFPLLWGLVAFLFNFVPNIGSIIAAIPAVLLALVQNGPLNATLVTGGYVAINMVIGNIVEPRVMGERLGLSTLVVFLSLVFWGWLWGPVGMLLSVPLTVVVKIVLEHSRELRGVAVLLGPADAPPPPGDDAPPPAG